MKTYILGDRRNAQKAQKAIEKLQKKYEKSSILDQAQQLFANEKYEDSYEVITGKRLKKRPKDRGAVVHALRGVNLEIEQGDMVAVMGPSGSGKSTLLNMMGMLDSPTAGRIYIKGRNVAAIKKRELPDLRANELGFVFQSFNLIPTLTALENVTLSLKYSGISHRRRRRLAEESLNQVGLGDRLHHRPAELSGGQQQRVAIARSVANNPSIVFGDELTGELDTAMTADVMKLVTRLNKKGQTFVIVTHNPDVAKVCRRIIYMRDGKIEKEVTKQKSTS
ncbi:ABC transporter ATP-binding protein [Candidatus Saccharibacteria bacterium]|nr:ABC transporter ATP-binding protein [Candidatus Saccharibacteria bacterium]